MARTKTRVETRRQPTRLTSFTNHASHRRSPRRPTPGRGWGPVGRPIKGTDLMVRNTGYPSRRR
eukprot:7382863-Prymnesium_polylepis.1